MTYGKNIRKIFWSKAGLIEQESTVWKKYGLAENLQNYGFVKGFISFTRGGVTLLCQLNLYFYFDGFLEGTKLTA